MNFHSMMEHYPLHGLMSPWQTLSFQKDHAFTVNLLAMETAESVKHFFHVDGKAKRRLYSGNIQGDLCDQPVKLC